MHAVTPAQRVEPCRFRGYKTLKQMIKVHLKLTQVGTEAEQTEAVASVVASFQQLMAIVSSKEGSQHNDRMPHRSAPEHCMAGVQTRYQIKS